MAYCRDDIMENVAYRAHIWILISPVAGRQSHRKGKKRMSNVVNAAVEKLGAKIDSFGSTAKFVIEDECAIMIDRTAFARATKRLR